MTLTNLVSENARPWVHHYKELPDDVLSIIRAYSKPLFRWYKEYNEARSLFAPNFTNDDFIKLKEKMDNVTIRDQVNTCIDAYKQGEKVYDEIYKSGHQIDERYSQEYWWFSISIEKLGALLYDREYRMLNFAEWVFKDDIDDAWMDDSDWDDGRDEELLLLQEEWDEIHRLDWDDGRDEELLLLQEEWDEIHRLD